MCSDSCFFLWSLKPSDCAAWVQAWGSILAIVAAAAIAFIQARSQRLAREAADAVAASVVASSILELLEPLKGFLESLVELNEETGKDPLTAVTFVTMLNEITLPTEAQALMLVPSRPRVAAKLTRALNLVHQLRLALKLESSGPVRKSGLDIIRSRARMAREEIFDIQEQLTLFLALNGLVERGGGRASGDK